MTYPANSVNKTRYAELVDFYQYEFANESHQASAVLRMAPSVRIISAGLAARSAAAGRIGMPSVGVICLIDSTPFDLERDQASQSNISTHIVMHFQWEF